jgi:RNA polymerase-binding transcription factor DksA
MSQEKTRFSDSDLTEFKELIQNKLKEARIDLDLLIGSLSHNDDHGTDDTGRTFNMMEDGSETLSREEMSQLASRQEKFIQSLQAALVRIENKTYGICRVTGKLIAKERLRLVPHATMSIEAKNAQNN